MRIAVIGAGIIGVTTAYELGSDGHDVTVFERRGSIAAESSFANAGVVAPGYVTPWAGPGMRGKVVRHLLSRHAAVRVHPNVDLGWAWQWWRACRARTYEANRRRMQRLAAFSRERLHHITANLRLDYERQQGYLVLLRSAKDLALAQPGLALLGELGTRFALVDAAECRVIEPGLAEATALHAGIRLPDDEVGNCRQFAVLLRRKAEQLGVRFRLQTIVQRIEPGAKPRLVWLRTSGDAPNGAAMTRPTGEWADTEPLGQAPISDAFDAIVVCAGIDAVDLLRPLGLKLPLVPVYGYSVTAPMRHVEYELGRGPRAALMDEQYKVAISRLGGRIRVAGSAEIGGRREAHHPGALATLYKVLDDWFPGAADKKLAQQWKGARPMLPDGPPVVGPSGADGVWLNLGHGSSGWALGCGSARLVADAIAGRPAPIDSEGLGIERLRA